MRRVIDYDSELKALACKAKQHKERRVRQLGELVAATGADALDAEVLTGALLAAVNTKDTARQEEWRKAGEAFFHSRTRKPGPRSGRQPEGALPFEGGTASH